VLSVQCNYPDSVLILAACGSGVLIGLWNKSWRRAALVLAVGMAAALSLLPYWGPIHEAGEWAVILRRPVVPMEILDALEKAVRSTESPSVLGSLNQFIWLALYVAGIPAALIYLIFLGKIAPSREAQAVLFAATLVVTTTIGFWLLIQQ